MRSLHLVEDVAIAAKYLSRSALVCARMLHSRNYALVGRLFLYSSYKLCENRKRESSFILSWVFTELIAKWTSSTIINYDNRSRCPPGYNKPCEHRKIKSSLILSCGAHRAYSQVDIGYDYQSSAHSRKCPLRKRRLCTWKNGVCWRFNEALTELNVQCRACWFNTQTDCAAPVILSESASCICHCVRSSRLKNH